MTTAYHPTTGRPLRDDQEAVETLSDEELQTELTVASHDPVRRARRFERLESELAMRRRGYRRHIPPRRPS